MDYLELSYKKEKTIVQNIPVNGRGNYKPCCDLIPKGNRKEKGKITTLQWKDVAERLSPVATCRVTPWNPSYNEMRKVLQFCGFLSKNPQTQSNHEKIIRQSQMGQIQEESQYSSKLSQPLRTRNDEES